MTKKVMLLCVFYISTLLYACSEQGDGVNLGTASSCDASVNSCLIQHEQYRLGLILGPDVRTLTPFDIKFNVIGDNMAIESVIVDFSMADMDMGLNRYRLTKSDEAWVGHATLPVCIASRTDWLAKVEFMDDGKKYFAIFPFHTDVR